MLLDLHIHSRQSNDALNKPAELVGKAAEKGIGFAITDHNSCGAWPELKKLAAQRNVPLILGTEIKVTRGKKLLGEILGLFLKKPVETRDFYEAVSQIHKQHGIVAAPHPFDIVRKPYLRGFDELPSLVEHIDAIEVFNSRTIIPAFNRRARAFAEASKKPMICGSDAHIISEVGNSLTEVNAKTLEEAKNEILAGRTILHCRRASLLVHFYSAYAKIAPK
ncbi:MAG: PHP domain-containing protein [Candidatus Diapherotrites archaeon]|uniref:PHP domain-containing protein n=1 Tax=Candidatus Iainarchaeum sp. TaxID=3101447 RepID=A0A938YQK2_9ARCH|nr:PHP domain-containing protein [Candidatus Diapherotrites archaeon]